MFHSELIEFERLAIQDASLGQIGKDAAAYARNDPAACLMKLRLFGELLAKCAGERSNLRRKPFESADAYLERLEARKAIPKRQARLFHEIRIAGNEAAHGRLTRRDTAQVTLRNAKELADWYLQTSPTERTTSTIRFSAKQLVSSTFESNGYQSPADKLRQRLRRNDSKKV